jgi:hypothetical protein
VGLELQYYFLGRLSKTQLSHTTVVLGGVLVSMLATGHKVFRVQTWLGVMIFKGDNNTQHAFIRRESKTIDPIP